MAKVTKREVFVAIAEILEAAGEVEKAEFIDAQIALLDKRKGAERKLTKTQVENEAIKENIVGILNETENGLTATEVALAVDETVQKVAQLLRQLKDAGEVAKTDAKGKEKARFAIAE